MFRWVQFQHQKNYKFWCFVCFFSNLRTCWIRQPQDNNWRKYSSHSCGSWHDDGHHLSSTSLPNTSFSVKIFKYLKKSSQLLDPWIFQSLKHLSSCTEPVGSVSPKKTTGDDIKVIWGAMSNNIGILCPAQAYPTPVFRWVPLDILKYSQTSCISYESSAHFKE